MSLFWRATGQQASALVASSGFLRTSNGFVGVSDGWTDLSADRKLDSNYDTAPDGNVLQTGELPLTDKRGGRESTFTLALGFLHRPPMQSAPLGRAFGTPFVAQVPPTTRNGAPIYVR